MAEPWWKSAVVYQIYPRSFADSNGDGVGDLEGIRAHVEHLRALGVDAIWISPFFRSPMADYGYDVSDYCDVDPLFGTLADFDRLLAEVHDAGMRMIIDWVPNHSSDQHPWFVESRSSRDNPKRDWYVWRDGGGRDQRPNNWKAAFGGDAWTWDHTTEQWYLHLFLPEQPDLNWANPDVREAMHGTLRFWLDRGVDGFRVDVIHGLGKDSTLPDLPSHLAEIPPSGLNDQPVTHEYIRDLRQLLDEYPGDRMMVGEVYLLQTKRVAQYYGDGDELHLAFNFPPLYAPWEARAWRERIDEVLDLYPDHAWPSWVLSNHDNPRHRSRYGGSEARARAAAVLLLTLRGTPFMYEGEELGLEDAVIPPDRRVDPGGRDGTRAPVPWDGSPSHGWPGDEPWLPWPPKADERNAAALDADSGSILHLYRRVLAARRGSPALSLGSFAWLDVPASAPDVLGWRRQHDGDERAVLVNFGGSDAEMPGVPAGDWVVDVASDGAGEGETWTGRVPADAAVVLRPA